MLDVHPPHSPTHTWKDFFIHIATIVVGLLIAVGLEQTVEYFHHRHQLHQLREDLHAESLRNLHIALANIDECEHAEKAANAVYQEVVSANQAHRSPVLHSEADLATYSKPAYAAWTVAQQSGTLGLLPHDEAQRYVRVYSLVDQSSSVFVQQNAAFGEVLAGLKPGVAVLSSDQRKLDDDARNSAAWAALDAEDFRRARNALAAFVGTTSYGASRNVFLYGMEWSVINGSRTDDENLRILYDAVDTYYKAGKAGLLAKYPLPRNTDTPPVAPEQ